MYIVIIELLSAFAFLTFLLLTGLALAPINCFVVVLLIPGDNCFSCDSLAQTYHRLVRQHAVQYRLRRRDLPHRAPQ